MANLGSLRNVTVQGTSIIGQYPPAVVTPTVVVPLRTPQFGLTLEDRQAFLTAQLPNAGATYVALFSTMPARSGVGGVEASGSGYVRVQHSTWVNSVLEEFVAQRANNGLVTFPTLTGDLTVAGWGVYSALNGGVLLAFGLLRNVDGKARVFELASGDIPNFPSGALVLGIQ